MSDPRQRLQRLKERYTFFRLMFLAKDIYLSSMIPLGLEIHVLERTLSRLETDIEQAEENVRNLEEATGAVLLDQDETDLPENAPQPS